MIFFTVLYKDGREMGGRMTHFQEMLLRHEQETLRIQKLQILDSQDENCGAFTEAGGHIDTRHCGFLVTQLVVGYLIPECRFFHDETLKSAIENGFRFLLSHHRADGCLDLTACNFDSAPDTAFTMNAMFNAWWLLEKDTATEVEWLRSPMKQLIEICCEGVMNGGFHTPNHRWAISACLKHAAGICGRDDFSRKADLYLGEGLDIDENGEFAERSTGTYNAVNDDQMIRLFLATGDKTYLEAAKSNLLMMLSYIDPDGSVFTNNSTRQDYGHKVYLESYYVLFLLTGYLLKDEQLSAFSEYCWETATAHGGMPHGLPWLALYPDLEDYGKRQKPDLTRIQEHKKLFKKSNIGRMRRGSVSCTVMSHKPNFLYFQHGENSLYLVLYCNVCDKRNFIPSRIEETENGFRVSSTVDSWYYMPFQGDVPSTSDWWAMDNANTREKLILDKLTITVDIAWKGDGVDVRIQTEGLDGVPVRLEWGFLPGNSLRNEHFILEAVPRGTITVCGGKLQAENKRGEMITLTPAFARHNVQNRMGGAYPLSQEHFTVFFTDYSPFEHVIHIGTEPVFGLRIQQTNE